MPVRQKVVTEIDGKEVNARMIDSTNVMWVGWPTSGEPLMLVMFRSGLLYGYLGVSRQRAVAAAHAQSTGQYINQRIKKHFKAVKIDGRNPATS